LTNLKNWDIMNTTMFAVRDDDENYYIFCEDYDFAETYAYDLYNRKDGMLCVEIFDYETKRVLLTLGQTKSLNV